MKSESVLTRRQWTQLSSSGALGAGLSGWFPQLAHAATKSGKHKSCILLWMDGGPSHIDTFDPKPDAPERVRGEFTAIDTSAPGVQICEKLPKVARLMQHAAILRGMSTEEADHGRARMYMHSGYKPGQGGVTYPGLGSIVSAELGEPDFPLPNFVATGRPLNKYDFLGNPGFLGPRHQALVHANTTKKLENLDPLAGEHEFNDRASVVDQLEAAFQRTYKSDAANAHHTTFQRAMRLMRSDRSQAFDLSLEPAKWREAYGDNYFGRGCLLARRLVEVGVPFVEVYMSNWDTHEKKSADEIHADFPLLDQGMSTLVSDLAERGLLDDTLVIWMGEFGRTPQINRNGGRDHYSKAWSTVLLGGGVRGGQVIGRTDKDGASVVDRPIGVKDFMATVCTLLGINHTKQIQTAVGRPIRIVDTGGEVIKEVVG
jgi:hypothetical protein